MLNAMIAIPGRRTRSVKPGGRRTGRSWSVLPLVALLVTGLTTGSAAPASAEEPPAGHLDVIIFGDRASESAHGLAADSTAVVTGRSGQPARVAKPLDPPDIKGGELRFTMRVDPSAQNYFSLKFWGSDVSPYKSIVYLDGEQVGYRRAGDYEAINTGSSRPLVDRFYYNTVMLPLSHTTGRRLVEITVRTYDANFTAKVTADSRGYYRAFTHTGAHLDTEGEQHTAFTPPTEPAPDKTPAEKQALIDGYTASQVKLFDDYSAKVDATATGRLSIVRYQDELRFYAQALLQDWSPARTAAQRRSALDRILKSVDNHVKDYYGNVRLLASGGHQSDWGGYYGALGEALYIVENLLADDSVYGTAEFSRFLDQPFATNTADGPNSLAGVDWNGGELTRREAWERVLKANFDFARSRLSYIYNQVMYTYEGAWEAHEGLRLIGSPHYEGRPRSHAILLEALGARPFLGEEVLVGPAGRPLDLYHSLFYHDGSARFTEDYLQVVMKGLARSATNPDGTVRRRLPLGRHFTTISGGGLTRENGYVANYGESANYLPEHFYRTLGHAGDESLNDEILKLALKNLHARGYTRYTDVDENGRRTMRMEQVVDERNTAYPGNYGYAIRLSEGKALLYASLERHMARNETRYADASWDDTWRYAREAVGFAQQQLADNQYFNNFSATASKNKVDYRLAETYRYVTGERADYPRFGKVQAGVVHPQTDFRYYTADQVMALDVDPADYERFAWVDVDTLFLSMRDGDTRIFGSLNERNRGYAGNGRLHVINGTHDNIVQVETDAKFRYEDYWARMDNIDVDFMEDQQVRDGAAPQALAGEVLPITHQPGVGTVRRDNFEPDTGYSAYPDLLTARYGDHLMAFNTTRDAHGNKRTFEVDLPAGHPGGTVHDLVSGQDLPVVRGKVAVAPQSAVVLRLTSKHDAAPRPAGVDFVTALPGDRYVGVSWKAAAGATSYTVKRASKEDGPYVRIAEGVRGTYFKDLRTSRDSGKKYYYTVTPVNRNGIGWESYRAVAEPGRSGAERSGGDGWRVDRIGGVTAGTAAVSRDVIRIRDGNGAGLADGDDYRLDGRAIDDSFRYASQVVDGGASITAKVGGQRGEASGLMFRADLGSNTRYVYFGADANGDLVLRNRTRDSRHDWQDEKRSPLDAGVRGFSVAQHPHLRLVRDLNSHLVTAFASGDGEQWTFVGSLYSPLPRAAHAGVVASDDAEFSSVRVRAIADDAVLTHVVRQRDEVVLHWNKPDPAVSFAVYRTTDAGVSRTNPLGRPEGWQEIASGERGTSLRDQVRYGTNHYRVVATGADGRRWVSADAVAAVAEPLRVVLERAEALSVDGWTKGSHFLFAREIAQVRAESAKPGHDERALVDRVYAAYGLLVSADTLLREFPLEPAAVAASTVRWPGTGTKASNGWLAFDGDTTTYTDTIANPSWIDITPGAAGPVVLDKVRLHPRPGSATRGNGTVLQGSHDDGATWEDIHTITGLTEDRWYVVALPRTTSYPRLRIYDDHNGRVNLAEVEFLRYVPDATLLTVLRADGAAVERQHHTPESLAALDSAMAAAAAVLADSGADQARIDGAAAELRTALANLRRLP